jgi:hypothetical protein
LDSSESFFKLCCGKLICDGCIVAIEEESYGRSKTSLCAFCREPTSNSEEEDIKRMKKLMEAGNADAFLNFAECYARDPTSAEEEVKQIKKLVEAGNAYAIYNLAGYYADGDGGMPQDFAKANELVLRAGELGCGAAYHNLGNSYYNGEGVEVDKKKATHYWELAAMNGDVEARHNLGYMEKEAGNHHRAMKHFILAAKAGLKDSLDAIKQGFMIGIVTKDEYANTLRAYQEIQDEMKSDTRERAREIDKIRECMNM